MEIKIRYLFLQNEHICSSIALQKSIFPVTKGYLL